MVNQEKLVLVQLMTNYKRKKPFNEVKNKDLEILKLHLKKVNELHVNKRKNESM
jgi:hypothetical protein